MAVGAGGAAADRTHRLGAGGRILGFAHEEEIALRRGEVRRQWAFVLFFVSLLVLFNTLITGGDVPSYTGAYDVFFTIPILGTPVSAQSLTYAATQLARFAAMTLVGFPIAYAKGGRPAPQWCQSLRAEGVDEDAVRDGI